MLLDGKKALIMGLANNRSIAFGIASELKAHGARLAFNYMNEATKKRVEKFSPELGGEFTFQCDVSQDDQIAAAVQIVKEHWGTIDVLVHSIAFAHTEDLKGRFIDTSREGFKVALEVSAYSLTALCYAFEPLFTENASVITMTYLGSLQIIPGYNVMGVAKAALEASVRYLAFDLGPQGVRVNAISAGPIKTLASSVVSSFNESYNCMNEHSLLRRNISSKDVGGAAVFLASDLSRCVTGEVIYVDSGFNKVGAYK